MATPLPPDRSSRPDASGADVLRAAKRPWLTKLNFAFALTSVIPLLICGYLITVRFFSFSILAGLNGVYFLFAVIMALLGLLAGRQLLHRLIQQLVAANEQLEQFNVRQGEFVSHVAHEFRAPLAIMKGALDNLRDGLHGTLTPEQVEPVVISQREATRLKRIVGDLLDLGQLESGKLRLLPSAVSLQDLLQGVAQSYHTMLKERGLRLELELPEAPVTLLVDRDRMAQVFVNLLTNAIKFTDRGSVRVRMMRDGDAVQVDVTDTGQGIAAEDLERIFLKFERAGNHHREGSGLGLAIAKAIVERHGGRLWVESQLGQGSRFIVRLPAPHGGAQTGLPSA